MTEFPTDRRRDFKSLHARLSVFVCVLVMIHIPVSAAAQTASQREAKYDPRTKGTGATRRALLDFTKCAVKKFGRSVDEALDIPIDNPEYDVAISKILSFECLTNDGLNIPRSIARGALFEALYRERYRTSNVPFDLRASPIIDYHRGHGTLPADLEQIPGLAQLGDCITRADPAKSRALITALPGSSDERDRLADIQPLIALCLAPGQSVRLSLTALRGGIAEALYRLTAASQWGAKAR